MEPNRNRPVAIDTHAHVFDADLPLVAGSRYRPARDAKLAEYVAHLDRHGLSHGVAVQPSFLGTDNGFLLRTLEAAGGRLRGVAVVDPDVSQEELAGLDAAGVVGVRLNLIGKAVPDVMGSDWRSLWRFCRDHRWHVEVHAPAADLPAILGPLLAQGLAVVVDHFGRPSAQEGTADPGFRFLLGQARTRQVWVKLSAGYRLDAPGSSLPAEAASQLIDAFGADRLVWGSDWPHTMHESETSYDEAIRAFEAWVPDAATRREMLSSTAASLFHVGATAV